MLTQILAILSVLFASVFYWGVDFHGTRMFVFMTLGVLWVSGLVYKRTHWSAALVLAYVLFSAAMKFANPISPFVDQGDFAVLTFDVLSACVFISISIVVIPLAMADRKVLCALADAFRIVCFTDSVFVIIQWFMGHSYIDRGAFFGNPSVNATIIGLFWPLVWARKYRKLWTFAIVVILPIIAILLSRSNMGLATLLTGMVTLFLMNKDKAKDSVICFVVLVCSMLGGAYWTMGSKLGDNNGRMRVWKAVMHWFWIHTEPLAKQVSELSIEPGHAGHWWAMHISPWFGVGAGSYFTLGQMVQKIDLHDERDFLLWMHSDWLQAFFELGYIGVTLIILMGCIALFKAAQSGQNWLVAAILAYAVAMTGNFPMHSPISGFFGVFLMVFALQKQGSKTTT